MYNKWSYANVCSFNRSISYLITTVFPQIRGGRGAGSGRGGGGGIGGVAVGAVVGAVGVVVVKRTDFFPNVSLVYICHMKIKS